MQVSLEAIKFNHDPTFKKTGAFRLRRNETSIVNVPEWRHDSTEHSPAAYVTKDVPSPVTILASFFCDDASVKAGEVQALSLGGGDANVLGDIPKHDIRFNNRRSGLIPLELTNATLREAAIGIHDITWRWQFSEDSRSWRDLQTTNHRIYTVLAPPTKPWVPRPQPADPPTIHNPWTEVLDYACAWATGVKDDRDEAATRVAENVYKLGKTLVKYARGPSYAYGRFDCTKFLKLLKTGIGGNQTVNCDDCATIVSTFANILGCDLHQSGMGTSFRTNRILPIGAAAVDWQTTMFLHHAVAWKGFCQSNDALFDGCFQLDNDGEPESPPEDAFQPANIKFGDFSDKAYKFCLVEKNASCQPLPNSQSFGRKRRQLGRGFLSDEEISEEGFVDQLREIYEFNSWPPVEHPEARAAGEAATPASLFKPERIFPEWELYECDHLEDERFKNVFVMLFNRPSPDVQELLTVNVYECRQMTDPYNFLLQVLGSFEQLTITRMENTPIGNVSFQETGEVAVLFRRNRFVGVVRSAGKQSISVKRFATLLDQILIS